MRLKDTARRLLLGVHRLGLRFRVQILPDHFYSPVPNVLELRKSRRIWAVKSQMPGLDASLDEQSENLKQICLPYRDEYMGSPNYIEATRTGFGPGYGYIESQALHGVIRHLKPRRIVEVGGGVSTYCMLQASALNLKETGHVTEITSIEPYPSDRLQGLGGIRLIAQPVQAVGSDAFSGLEAGDFLFIDSSHAVKAGSDVNYLILEVLPRLRRGVLVHFHDIFFPYDYQPDTLRTLFHWSETSLLRAFLINNHKVTITFCLSHLHYERPNTLREVFPEYVPAESQSGLFPESFVSYQKLRGHFPCSIYLEIQ